MKPRQGFIVGLIFITDLQRLVNLFALSSQFLKTDKYAGIGMDEAGRH